MHMFRYVHRFRQVLQKLSQLITNLKINLFKLKLRNALFAPYGNLWF